ncbi:MAG: hypothetical protein ACLQPD_32850 [Desulfomonilaceae bacterium]
MCTPGRESGSVVSPPTTHTTTGPGSHSSTDLAIRPVDVKGWAGTWNEKGAEKDTFCDALNKFEDVQLKKWVAGNMEINRFREDDFSPMTAFGSTLRVKNSFFSQQPA